MNKKILVIPDIHGELFWQRALLLINDYDKIIFLGDYLDAWDDLGISDDSMAFNLLNIINFKLAYPDKIEILLGNHELSYMFNDCICSGYRPFGALTFNQILHKYNKLFKIVHKEGLYLFSHAGITKGWLNKNEEIILEYGSNYIDGMNNTFQTNNYKIFNQLSHKRGGHEKYGSPVWADMQETATGGLMPNYIQIVGHTPTKTKEPFYKKYPDSSSSILFCDCSKLIELEIIDDKTFTYKVI